MTPAEITLITVLVIFVLGNIIAGCVIYQTFESMQRDIGYLKQCVQEVDNRYASSVKNLQKNIEEETKNRVKCDELVSNAIDGEAQVRGENDLALVNDLISPLMKYLGLKQVHKREKYSIRKVDKRKKKK